MILSRRHLGFLAMALWPNALSGCAANRSIGELPPRVVVSTDIGGTDPDDFQSLVHLLVYADSFDIEGLISSPFGPGRKAHILETLECYERDYSNLKRWSSRYPSPDVLRAMTMQGETEVAPYSGVRGPTEGSRWIVTCARRDDPRPLHVLVWGGIEDLAQALHDAPDILAKLRVYFIGGPNKKWSVDAYHYIATNHRSLWIIEANATYRGWFTGGDQSGEWGNTAFVATHISGRGALGDYFATHLGGTVKMGDTPSVARLLHGAPEHPEHPGWGGRYVRAWERPYLLLPRLSNSEDRLEQFGVLELVLPLGSDAPARLEATMMIENQSLIGHPDAEGGVRFRFSPKDAKTYDYAIRSNDATLDGRTGELTSFVPAPEAAQRPASHWPNWWTDDPAQDVAEGVHLGAKTVSQWRREFLSDFAARMSRCAERA